MTTFSKSLRWSLFNCISNINYLIAAVDGNWGPWSRWSNCVQSCGGVGKRRRSRYCIDPPPEHGGRPCEGYGVQAERCTTGTSSLLINCFLQFYLCTVLSSGAEKRDGKSREGEERTGGKWDFQGDGNQEKGKMSQHCAIFYCRKWTKRRKLLRTGRKQRVNLWSHEICSHVKKSQSTAWVFACTACDF